MGTLFNNEKKIYIQHKNGAIFQMYSVHLAELEPHAVEPLKHEQPMAPNKETRTNVSLGICARLFISWSNQCGQSFSYCIHQHDRPQQSTLRYTIIAIVTASDYELFQQNMTELLSCQRGYVCAYADYGTVIFSARLFCHTQKVIYIIFQGDENKYVLMSFSFQFIQVSRYERHSTCFRMWIPKLHNNLFIYFYYFVFPIFPSDTLPIQFLQYSFLNFHCQHQPFGKHMNIPSLLSN